MMAAKEGPFEFQNNVRCTYVCSTTPSRKWWRASMSEPRGLGGAGRAVQYRDSRDQANDVV
jgi:hypothetical protein